MQGASQWQTRTFRAGLFHRTATSAGSATAVARLSRLFELSSGGNPLVMFGWNAKTPLGQTFGGIYHQQYRQMRGTTASKVGAFLFPLSVAGAVVLKGRGPWLAVVLGVVAVILFVITAILTRRAHRAGRPRS